jgi:hypothetical protein
MPCQKHCLHVNCMECVCSLAHSFDVCTWCCLTWATAGHRLLLQQAAADGISASCASQKPSQWFCSSC